jgi:hypothetical protein
MWDDRAVEEPVEIGNGHLRFENQQVAVIKLHRPEILAAGNVKIGRCDRGFMRLVCGYGSFEVTYLRASRSAHATR